MIPDLSATLVSGLQPMLALPDLDTIVFLVVVVVSLLGRLFGKKDPEHAEEWIDAEDWNDSKKTGGQESSPPKGLNWEEELRRLLEGRQPVEKARPKPPVDDSPPPLPYLDDRVVVIPRSQPTPEAAATPGPTKLKQAEEAFLKARELKRQAAARMAEVGRLPDAQPRRRTRSGEAQSVIDMLRRPRSARKAIIASVILGPAKGLR